MQQCTGLSRVLFRHGCHLVVVRETTDAHLKILSRDCLELSQLGAKLCWLKKGSRKRWTQLLLGDPWQQEGVDWYYHECISNGGGGTPWRSVLKAIKMLTGCFGWKPNGRFTLERWGKHVLPSFFHVFPVCLETNQSCLDQFQTIQRGVSDDNPTKLLWCQ